MNVLYVWSDLDVEYNCSWYRCHSPYLALKRAGYDVSIIFDQQWAANGPDAQRLSERADLILFQRNCWLADFGAIIYWRSRGKVVVLDFDDAYHLMT